jgi:dTMP kinase
MCAGYRKGRIVISGKFIVFEGIDGSGKSTQMNYLKQWLEDIGQRVTIVREPGGTELSEKIRQLLLDHRSRDLGARAEALLFSTARSQLVHEVILPALSRGEVVLCDRYKYSTIAYQGYGRELPMDEVIATQDFATSRLQPDLKILLDLEVDTAASRMADAPADRMESAGKAFQERVRMGYLQLAQAEPEAWLILDATQSADVIAEIIRSFVERHFMKE